jgi:hypothetical protein
LWFDTEAMLEMDNTLPEQDELGLVFRAGCIRSWTLFLGLVVQAVGPVVLNLQASSSRSRRRWACQISLACMNLAVIS